MNSNEHVLLITMHHSVTDGWSTGIIWKELSAAYNAFHRGKVNVGLAPLPIQYADFATWQRRWLAQGAMSAQASHPPPFCEVQPCNLGMHLIVRVKTKRRTGSREDRQQDLASSS